MSTQFVTSIVTQSDSFEAGKEAADLAMNKLQSKQPHLIVLFCSDKYEHEAVLRGVKSVTGEVPVIGCSTAGQFSDEGVTKEGLACAMIHADNYKFFSGIGTNIKSDPMETLNHAIRAFPKEDLESYPHQSAILFIDGLAGKGEEAVLAAASLLGPTVKFAGAAAADNLSFRETVVFGNGQSLSDAVSLCLVVSRSPVIISFKHGHKPISPALKVTKARENILYELDGQRALEVWKNHVREPMLAKGVDVDKLDDQELSSYLLQYEVGLMTGEESEYKIRFPASCNADGSLNFTCSMMEGSVIKIMDSAPKDQIDSAQKSVQLALEASKGVKLAGAIIFDCVCRAMILKDQFPEAIKAQQEILGSLPFIGGETYGEIAMEAGKFSGFHNTTTVIMLFPA